MIWQRFLLKEIVKVFSFFLFGFFFLYCALDYSFHMQDFLKGKNIHVIDFISYYGHLFIKRSDLLIPLGVLIATIKVLTTLNTHRELLALQVAGLSFKKLIKPFFLLGGLSALFIAASMEWIVPHSTNYLDQFHNAHFSRSQRDERALLKKEKLHVLSLKDRSKIIYQHYDKEKDAYFDVIWIRTTDDIWRMKYLKTDGKYPVGEYVDHFVRNREGLFEKTFSHTSCELTPLKWNNESVHTPVIPYENRKASALWSLAHRSTTTSYERAEIMTNFYLKSAIPLLPLLVVIATAPFCVRYSRTGSAFFIYALGIFGYITFYLFINASLILGESSVVSPFIAIYAPFILCGSFFIGKFFKTT